MSIRTEKMSLNKLGIQDSNREETLANGRLTESSRREELYNVGEVEFN